MDRGLIGWGILEQSYRYFACLWGSMFMVLVNVVLYM